MLANTNHHNTNLGDKGGAREVTNLVYRRYNLYKIILRYDNGRIHK